MRAGQPPNPEVRKHYLSPAELHVSGEPCVITTIVGSCVAVCLTDRQAGAGGMNHFVLPERPDRGGSARYGPFAMEMLIESLLARGARRGQLEAKVFGGASLVAMSAGRIGRLGSRNVRVAYEALEAAGIPIVAADVEGHRGRKIIYHAHDGVAWVRRL